MAFISRCRFFFGAGIRARNHARAYLYTYSPAPATALATPDVISSNLRNFSSDHSFGRNPMDPRQSNPQPSMARTFDVAMSNEPSQTSSKAQDIPVQNVHGKGQHEHQADESKKQKLSQQQQQHQGSSSRAHPIASSDQSHRMSDQPNQSSSWLSDFFTHPFESVGQLMNYPRQQQLSVDIVNNPNEVIVRAECPGIRKEDVKITLDGDMLTIAGERRSENYEKGANFVRRECSYGSMSRSLRLPDDAELDKISAKYQDGVLNITLPRNPKPDDAKQSKNIPIH